MSIIQTPLDSCTTNAISQHSTCHTWWPVQHTYNRTWAIDDSVGERITGYNCNSTPLSIVVRCNETWYTKCVWKIHTSHAISFVHHFHAFRKVLKLVSPIGYIRRLYPRSTACTTYKHSVSWLCWPLAVLAVQWHSTQDGKTDWLHCVPHRRIPERSVHAKWLFVKIWPNPSSLIEFLAYSI